MKPTFRGHCSFEIDGISKEEEEAFDMLEKYFESVARTKGAAKYWHNKYDAKNKELYELKNNLKEIKKSLNKGEI